MTQPTYSLPPRKWYTLEQAAKRIAKLTGEEIEVADLIHYWYLGKIEIFTHIVKNSRYLKIGSYDIDLKKDVDFFEDRENLKSVRIEKIFCKESKDFINGFFSIIFPVFNYSTIEKEVLNKNGISLNFLVYLASPKQKKAKRLFFSIRFNDFDFAKNSIVNFDDLYILNDAINDFLLPKKSQEIEKMRKYAQNLLKMGRPEHSLKSLILEIARETFKYNPQASPHKLATAIFNYVEKHYFEEYGTIDLRTISNYIKEAKLGLPKSKNASKVTIKDPLKTE